uniref:Uncharacterized protein n=1 Tax=Alexandrium monilatum TaxID=311494 RepID=A0A7S4RSK4_9DINO|mmetsp:Transcript_21716/g.65267  ORF Transcript_21716/g.65267 Transcript_21716/m.65267 type:complete len:191 (-) Transcript_21716:108-680(-)
MEEPGASASTSIAPDWYKIQSPGSYKERRQRRQRLHGLHCYLAQTGVAAVAATQHQSRLDAAVDTDSGQGTLAVGVSQWIQDAVCTVGSAIGLPPQRPFEDPDAPSLVLWACDMAVGSSLAVVVFFTVAFTGVNALDRTAEETQDQIVVIGPDKWLVGRMKMIIVVWVSAVSGGLLNVKHVLWSTMLLGF